VTTAVPGCRPAAPDASEDPAEETPGAFGAQRARSRAVEIDIDRAVGMTPDFFKFHRFTAEDDRSRGQNGTGAVRKL